LSLTLGTRLGPCEILSALGAGGMGEVYRARDTKLGRDVAIKILPAEFTHDPDRVARFQREAHVLASLNHPNIAAIYGLEETNGLTALVLELVEGPTLADRIAQGPVPLDEALPIARQIAEALQAAHEQGIIHRDLKPANVKVRDDGTVKVLDFGLAKALEPTGTGSTPASLANSPTITSPAMMTGVGVILGTAAYMAPEQAKGRPADKRSDIWAFGCVLFEILTGKRAFAGEDLSDTLADVLKGDPDWASLPATTPPPVRALAEGCLRKDRKHRIGDISTALYLLNQPPATSGAPPTVADRQARPQPLWRRAIPVVLSAIVAGALAGTAAWYLSLRPATPLAVTRLPFTLPEGQAFSEPIARHMIALSADGAQIAYVANTRLYLRSMSELDVHAIQGTERYLYVTDPVFSPDGRSIAFYAAADQTLKKIATTGGVPVTICPADAPLGITWGPEGIVFGQRYKGIMRVSPNGGTPDVLVSVKDDEEPHRPQLLPGGQHVLFTLATGTAADRWEKARIVVQSVASGERKTLIEGGADARYVPTGHLVYAVGGSLFAVAFDLQRLEVRGGPAPMVEGVRRSSGRVTGAAHFSLSSTGSLIYIPGPVSRSSGPLEFAVSDRKGEVERLKLPPGAYLMPRASPDGTRITFGTDDGKEAIVWIYDLSGRSTSQRLTYGGNNRFPIWSWDSKRVAFQSDRQDDLAIFWQSAAGGTAERLTKPEQGESHAPESWSPKGDRLLFSVTKGSDVSLQTFSLQDKKATPFGDVHSEFPVGARFSPDGRWVAYASTERGTTTIYVEPFPTTGDKYQLSAKALSNPHEVNWSPDGKELFYVPRIGGFEAVSVTTKPTFAFGDTVAVPRPFLLGPPNSPTLYDIAPNGKFVGLITAGQTDSGTATAPQIQVVLNWFEELKARVPTQ
jgi:eukaryotic-like serine/threonine-protein kinase